MSSLPYIQQLSKVIVAQITQTIGWNSIQTTPLELLTDILHKYLEELTRQTQRYTELCKWRTLKLLLFGYRFPVFGFFKCHLPNRLNHLIDCF